MNSLNPSAFAINVNNNSRTQTSEQPINSTRNTVNYNPEPSNTNSLTTNNIPSKNNVIINQGSINNGISNNLYSNTIQAQYNNKLFFSENSDFMKSLFEKLKGIKHYILSY